MTTHATSNDRRLFQVWYYDGDGENTCELVMLEDAELPYVERMFTDMYGDMGEIVVSPVASVQTLAELVTSCQYDPEDWT